MVEVFESPTGQLIIWLAVCAALIALGAFLVARYRRQIQDDGVSASDMLTNFRELYCRGELSDEEYRTIKTKLAGRLQQEINDTGENA